MRRLLPISIVLAALLAAIVGLRSGGSGDAASVAPGGAAPASSLDDLPDLIVQNVVDNQNFNCTQPAGLRITVANIGSGPAGASTAFVDGGFGGPQSVPVPAIGAGASTVVYSYVFSPGTHNYTVTADSGSVIVESDETNNVWSGNVQTTSLPTCTPTPTATSTATPTATPTATVTPDLSLPGHGVFTNNTGSPINTATVTILSAPYWASGMYVSSNAPGCAAPSLISETHVYNGSMGGVPSYYTFTVIQWPAPCVDVGETFTVDYASASPDWAQPWAMLSNEPLQPTATATNTPTATATPTATRTPALPDLVVLSISDWQQGSGSCTAPAGLRIVVQNQQPAGASASSLFVSAASGPDETVPVPALGGNQALTLYSSVAGIPAGDTYTANADSAGNVSESNEGNNTQVAAIPLLTAATCTPSPTPGTETPTVTPTPTGSAFQDTDGDGLPGSSDNCRDVYNPDQANNDRNFISNHPAYVVDDLTLINSDSIGDACDYDLDNDGVADADEVVGPSCPTAGPATNAASIDTDHDGYKDGYECGLGFNPASAASKPAPPAPGTDPDNDGLSTSLEASIGTNPNVADSDGDDLRDGWEVRGYASDPLSIDTDGDGTSDSCEAASLNTDRVVNVGDQAMLSAEVARPVPAWMKLANFDLNKDGVINVGDQAWQASRAVSGNCP